MPNYVIANTIKYGKKSKDIAAITRWGKFSGRVATGAMKKNGKNYSVKIVYNRFTKHIRHAHYYR